jgi:hypothetical protein
MEKPYIPSRILKLTGVTVKDDYRPIEDEADSRLLDGVEDDDSDGAPSQRESLVIDRIPRVFTRLEDWPYRTNLRCWVCDCTFADRPKFVPTYVRVNDGNSLEVGVLGNMCTFNCAQRWIETHLGGRASNEERWRAQDSLCLVYFLFTGLRVSRIKPAPSKTERRQYGGELDDDTFWRRMRELDPVAGLRDHTPGTIVPERDRVRPAIAGFLAKTAGHWSALPAAVAAEANTVWKVCESDSVAIGDVSAPIDAFIDSLLDGSSATVAATKTNAAAAAKKNNAAAAKKNATAAPAKKNAAAAAKKNATAAPAKNTAATKAMTEATTEDNVATVEDILAEIEKSQEEAGIQDDAGIDELLSDLGLI